MSTGAIKIEDKIFPLPEYSILRSGLRMEGVSEAMLSDGIFEEQKPSEPIKMQLVTSFAKNTFYSCSSKKYQWRIRPKHISCTTPSDKRPNYSAR